MVPSSFMISQITPGRVEAGEPGEVDRRLGLAGALEHAAVLGPQREDVAGLHQRLRASSAASIATWIVCARSAAEIPVVTPSRASTETVKAVCSGASFLAAIRLRPSSSQRSPVSVRQIRPAPLLGHEVDRLRGRELGRHRQVALVLAVLVVADDDHPPAADLVDRLLDGRERRISGGGLSASVAPFSLKPRSRST